MSKIIGLFCFCCIFLGLAYAQAQTHLQSKDSTDRLINRGYVGAGIGLPYGVVGINAELALNQRTHNNLYFTGGVGSTLRYGIAYNFGLNLYLLNTEKTWRPRVSMLYGVNGVHKDVQEENTYNGLTAGLGQLIQFGKHKKIALSLDALLIVSSGLFEKLDELDAREQDYELFGSKRIKFSVGFKGTF